MCVCVCVWMGGPYKEWGLADTCSSLIPLGEKAATAPFPSLFKRTMTPESKGGSQTPVPNNGPTFMLDFLVGPFYIVGKK